LGLVGFIIYVGGALVLFSYCFILTPLLEGDSGVRHLFPVGLMIRGSVVPHGTGLIYEFYWRSLLILTAGVLLFLVILSVVAIVDLTRGSLRPGGAYGDPYVISSLLR